MAPARPEGSETTARPEAASERIGRIERTGVFGGTFDPPHVGHVKVAAEVADALGLDRVLWMPAHEPPHKEPSSVTPFPLRLEMVRAAGADPRFLVSTLERELPGPSYTVETLRALARREPDAERFLILGADEYRTLDTWHEPVALPGLATLVVMSRGGEPTVDEDTRFPARFVPVTPVDVSSTEVRERVARGAPVEGLVPEGVLRVIRREGLYLEGR